MIAELKAYCAVLCRCNQPIPIPKRVETFQREIERGDQTRLPQAFILRCRACEHENVYLLKDIQEVEGEPRERIHRAKAAGR